jgi:hypothetical protein
MAGLFLGLTTKTLYCKINTYKHKTGATMKSIQIQGLTGQQKLLCDLLWSCETQEDVDRLIAALPEDAKHDARVVYELIIAAEFDNVDVILPELQEILDNLR